MQRGGRKTQLTRIPDELKKEEMLKGFRDFWFLKFKEFRLALYECR
jgi:hypothetical protein